MVERARSQSVAGLIEKSARRGRRNAEDGGKKLVAKRMEEKGEGVDEMPREMMKGYLSAIKFHLCGKSVRSRHSRVGRERLRQAQLSICGKVELEGGQRGRGRTYPRFALICCRLRRRRRRGTPAS